MGMVSVGLTGLPVSITHQFPAQVLKNSQGLGEDGRYAERYRSVAPCCGGVLVRPLLLECFDRGCWRHTCESSN